MYIQLQLKMKKTLLIILTIVCNSLLNAQMNTNYSKELELKELQSVKSKYRNFETKLERDIYDQHFRLMEHHIEKGFNKDQFIFDKNFTSFIQKIFSELQNSNKNYKIDNSRFFIIKNNIPNASSFGFDYYSIYNGLFNLVENEYQLAAVISHEIAHNYLNHITEEIKQNAEFVKDFKKEIKSIKKSEFIKLIKSQDEIIQKKYDLANQSRQKEISADSLGFIIYSNANYPKSEYLEMLNRLEKFNTPNTKILNDSIYYQLYEPAGITIKPKWLKLEKDNIFDGLSFTEHIDKDSIKSHPNTSDRKKWIQEKFKIEKIKDEVVKPSKEFADLKNIVFSDFYNTMFFNENYGNAIYLLMNDKQYKTDRKDIDLNLGIAFTKLYEGRLNHQFNKYVSIANANDEDKDYNRFLHFLWSLNTSDLKIIGDYYTKKAAQ